MLLLMLLLHVTLALEGVLRLVRRLTNLMHAIGLRRRVTSSGREEGALSGLYLVDYATERIRRPVALHRR